MDSETISNFHVSYWYADNVWYAKFHEIPWAVTYGKSPKKARKMARALLKDILCWAVDDNAPLPQPMTATMNGEPIGIEFASD